MNFIDKRYSEIVRLVPRSSENPAELDLYLGLALAQLQRFPEAKAALEDGERKSPREEHFPVELAGVAYRTNHLGEAEHDLRRALDLAPHDSYALNFLATIYLLRGNLPAALKYWNRIEAPRILQIEETPQPQVNRTLLVHAITLSPLSTMRLEDFETTDARIAALGLMAATITISFFIRSKRTAGERTNGSQRSRCFVVCPMKLCTLNIVTRGDRRSILI